MTGESWAERARRAAEGVQSEAAAPDSVHTGTGSAPDPVPAVNTQVDGVLKPEVAALDGAATAARSEEQFIVYARGLVAARERAQPLAAVHHDHRRPVTTRWLPVQDKPLQWAQEVAAGAHVGALRTAGAAADIGRVSPASPPTATDTSVAFALRYEGKRGGADVAAQQLRAVEASLFPQVPRALRVACTWGHASTIRVELRRRRRTAIPDSALKARALAKMFVDDRYAAQIWKSAGLTVRTERGVARPIIEAIEDSDTGVQLRVRPVPGQALAQFLRASEALSSLLDLPHLAITAGETKLRVIMHSRTHAQKFPDRVIPEPDCVVRVRSQAEAVNAYKDLRICVGRTADGRDLAYGLEEAIHTIIGGGTGAGKTRTVLTWLALLLVGGADVAIANCKPGRDYYALFASRAPGIRILAQETDAEIVRAITWVYDELQARLERETTAAAYGVNGYAERPIIFVVDEFPTFLRRARQRAAKGGPDDWRRIEDMIATLLQQGRSQRIHLWFLVQSFYDKGFPGDWMSNIKLRLWLGEPGKPTDMANFAGGDDGGTVALAAARPNKGIKGRGIVMVAKDGDEEALTAQTFQAPYGYTPNWDPTRERPDAETLSLWQEFEQTLTLTPRFEPRLGLDFVNRSAVEPDPAYTKVKDGVVSPASAPGGGDEDWTKWSVAELGQLPLVELDGPDGPIPERRQLDLTTPEYRRVQAKRRNPIHQDPSSIRGAT